VGPVVFHYSGNTVVDHAQPLRPRVALNADTPACDAHVARAVGIDHTETGNTGARIDAQDAVAQLPVGLHLSRFVSGGDSTEILSKQIERGSCKSHV
jgi:hypothetical protein